MTEAPEKLTTGEPLGIEDLIKYLPALGEISQGLLKNYALGAAVLRRYDKGDILCEEGEFGSTAFFIVSGNVDIYIANPLATVQTARGGGGFFGLLKRAIGLGGAKVKDEHGYITIDADVDLPKTKPLATLTAGDLFGEMTCRTFQPRSATVRATEDVVVVEMLRVILDMLMGTREVDADTKATTKVKTPTFKGTSFKKAMDDKYRARTLASHLRSVPIFAALSEELMISLRDGAELVSCNKGQVVCKQGDEADAFYLIRSGLVRVSQSMPGGDMVRTYLKRGEFFGEIGLLRSTPRTATCTALDAVDLVKIGAAQFATLLEKAPAIRIALDKVADARIAASQERKTPPGLQLDDFLNQGLYEAQNLLLIDLDHCTRCDACVNACAEAHDGVTRLIRDGMKYDHFLVPTACRSCRDPLCMTQCPVGSIRRKESLEIIIEDWCIGCTKCAELCPYGNINMHPFEVTKEVPAESPKPAGAEKKDAKPAATPAAAAAAAKGAIPAGPAKPPAPVPANAPSSQAEGQQVPAPSTDKTAPAGVEATPAKPAAAPVKVEAKTQTSEAQPGKPLAQQQESAGLRQELPTQQQEHAELQQGHATHLQPSNTESVSANAASVSKHASSVVNEPESSTKDAKSVPANAESVAKDAVVSPKTAPVAAKTAKPAPAKPASPASSPAKKDEPPKKMVKKKVTVTKATTCDLCTDLSVPSCVYACPHDAAKRVDPQTFFAAKGKGWSFKKKSRTTH